MLEPSGLYYPNRFARQFLVAMEDVMGLHGLNTILNMANLDQYIDQLPPEDMANQFDFVYLAALSQALEDMYGPRGGRGIALKIGRAAFSLGIKNFGALAGMASPTFVALPLEKRAQLGLNALAAVFTRFTDQESSIEEEETAHLFIAGASPFSWGRTADRPVCHALAGMIQEGMRWSSQGAEYHVYETECRAMGDERDVFRVHKAPIGGMTVG